jgi:hypothetical protein
MSAAALKTEAAEREERGMGEDAQLQKTLNKYSI